MISTPRSNDEDTVLFKRCPNPGCLEILDKANAYALETLAALDLEPYVALRQTEDYIALRHQLIAALVAGDLEQTKTVCREWCRLTITWIRRHQPATSDAA